MRKHSAQFERRREARGLWCGGTGDLFCTESQYTDWIAILVKEEEKEKERRDREKEERRIGHRDASLFVTFLSLTLSIFSLVSLSLLHLLSLSLVSVFFVSTHRRYCLLFSTPVPIPAFLLISS
jgi:hypothetical protein